MINNDDYEKKSGGYGHEPHMPKGGGDELPLTTGSPDLIPDPSQPVNPPNKETTK